MSLGFSCSLRLAPRESERGALLVSATRDRFSEALVARGPAARIAESCEDSRVFQSGVA
jgi:hypothetical protein